MNRKQRRAMRNEPRKFSESDVRKIARDASLETGKHSTQMTLAAACIALHDLYGFGQQRLMRMLEKVEDLTLNALCGGGLVDKLKKDVGVELTRSDDLEL